MGFSARCPVHACHRRKAQVKPPIRASTAARAIPAMIVAGLRHHGTGAGASGLDSSGPDSLASVTSVSIRSPSCALTLARALHLAKHPVYRGRNPGKTEAAPVLGTGAAYYCRCQIT